MTLFVSYQRLPSEVERNSKAQYMRSTIIEDAPYAHIQHKYTESLEVQNDEEALTVQLSLSYQ